MYLVFWCAITIVLSCPVLSPLVCRVFVMLCHVSTLNIVLIVHVLYLVLFYLAASPPYLVLSWLILSVKLPQEQHLTPTELPQFGLV